ncbi:hypothetical protein H6G64_03890 [Calothrix sp. FACHB-156]|nr:hypothetical protein [Calothrix sp. FACHB-156]
MPATISDVIVQFLETADRDKMGAIAKRFRLTLVDAREEPLTYLYETDTNNVAQLCEQLTNEDYVLVASPPDAFVDRSIS